MASAASTTIDVATLDQLNTAIAEIDAIGRGGTLPVGDYTIKLTDDIMLGTSALVGRPLHDAAGNNVTVDGTTVTGSQDLYALDPANGVSVTVDGRASNGSAHEINGDNTYRGFIAAGGLVTLQALQVVDTTAAGGTGGGGAGGGAGLGGGLFVASGSRVTLSGVTFSGNAAAGGAGTTGASGGGGGLGGAGGTTIGGGGGVGDAATGASAIAGAGSGILLGEADGGGGGGAFGGGGAALSGGGADGTSGAAGGFGGGGGAGGAGGFGGGGGDGGAGGFGGGAGAGAAGGFGAGDGDATGGGGGLGAGGDIFVQQGGILTIADGSIDRGAVAGGAGAAAGQAFGSGLFIQGNQTVTLAPSADQTLTIAGVIADQTGSGDGSPSGAGVLLLKGAGTVVLTAANTFTGGTTLQAGTLDLDAATTLNGAGTAASSGAAGTGAVTFATGATATLQIERAALTGTGTAKARFANTIAGFATTDTLDLRGIGTATASFDYSTDVLTLTGSTTTTLQLSGSYAGKAFQATADGGGGTAVTLGTAAPATIMGTHATTDMSEAAVTPFSGVAIADTSGGATDSLRITLSGAGGTLSGTGLTSDGDGSYSLAATSPATLTSELDALSFTPTNATPGATAGTAFRLVDTSSAGTTATDTGTTVTDTAPAVAATRTPPAPSTAPPAPTATSATSTTFPATTTTPPTTTTAVPAATTPAPVTPDAVSIDPAVTYSCGVFTLTGTASSAAGLSSIELSAVLDDGTRQDLGAATVNRDGTFDFADLIGAHQQGFITATLTDGAGGTATSADPLFSLTGGLHRGSFQARQTDYTPDGMAETSTSLFRAGGSRRVHVQMSDQTLTSDVFDMFQNHGVPLSTFVFEPGFGRDVVSLFRVDGTDHDTLSFKGSDYGNSIAAVLNAAHDTRAGLLITDPTPSSPGAGGNDTLLLKGITKQQFAANQGDIAFHA